MASVRKLWARRPLEVYHARTRTRGVNSPVYWFTRLFAQPALMLYFRLARNGHRHVPGGAVILASNHRSFLDPFVLGCCVRRPIYFVAKEELFKNPLAGWFLNCLGAFPLRRGASDEESVKTSLRLLERGQVVVIFPEGTRVTRGSLRPPRRGVGRMALESGAPVVPVAVSGSERARRGWRIRPVKVHLRFGPPLTFPRVDSPSPFLAGEVTERIWPCVALQWEWLGGLPPLRTAVVVGAGPMGTSAATVLARAGLEVNLTCRTREQAERIESGRREPGADLDRRIEVSALQRRGAGRGGPGGARGALQRPARGRGGDRRSPGRAQRRARGLAGDSCRRSAPRRRPSWPSACAPAPWPPWPGRPTPREAIEPGSAGGPGHPRRWSSGASSARCFRPAG